MKNKCSTRDARPFLVCPNFFKTLFASSTFLLWNYHSRSLVQKQRYKLTPLLEMHFDLFPVSSYSSINTSLNVISPLNPTAVDLVSYPSSIQSSSFISLPIPHILLKRSLFQGKGLFLVKPIIRNSFLYNVSGGCYCPRSGHTTWSDWREEIFFHSLNRGFCVSSLPQTRKLLAIILQPLGNLRSNSAHRRGRAERSRTMELVPRPHCNFYHHDLDTVFCDIINSVLSLLVLAAYTSYFMHLLWLA